MIDALLLALLGLPAGVLINALADSLPARARPHAPACRHCDHAHRPAHWLAGARHLTGRDACPTCGQPEGIRPLAVEAATVALFAFLGWTIDEPLTRYVTAFYCAVLILVIVTDLEHRLIFHAVTFPVTVLALAAGLFLPGRTWALALAGAAGGFLLFLLLFWLGRLLFGPGSLGFGDVTLATMLGAMLGFDRIFFALILGILLGGVMSLGLLVFRLRDRRSVLPYGPYLAFAGILMLIWGQQIYLWYVG